jgi:hypothetical protein
MRIILHIGTHKTATTFLQGQLHGQRDSLARQGVHYLADGPNHSWMYLAFCEAPETEHGAMRLGLVGRAEARAWAARRRDLLREEIASCALPRILISAEELCRLSGPSAETLISLLREYAGQIDVVCFVRDMFGYAISDAQESIKGGLTWEQALCAAAQSNFRAALEHYTRLIGRNAVSVFPFRQAAGADVLADFAGALGLALHRVDTVVDSNVALSAEAAFILSEINRAYPPFLADQPNPDRAVIPSTWLDQIGQSPFGLPKETLVSVHQTLRGDYDWLAEFVDDDWFADIPVDRFDWHPLDPSIQSVLHDSAMVLHKAAKTIEDSMVAFLLQSARNHILKGNFKGASSTLENVRRYRPRDQTCHSLLASIQSARPPDSGTGLSL